MLLPDVNVWFALTFDSHAHHPPAKSWFDALSGEVCVFCRLTQQGFLRLVTNANVFGQDALTMIEAWQNYDLLQSGPFVSYTKEPAGIEPLWRSHSERQSFSPKVWNDAYLAAFAQMANLELITFDQSLAQYQKVRVTILS